MDRELIRANIALYNDEYGEVRRLLAPYLSTSEIAQDQRSLLMWLDAHQHLNYDERRQKLEELIRHQDISPDDPYAESSRYFLELEGNLQRLLQPTTNRVSGLFERRLFGIPIFATVATLIAGAMLALLVLALGNFATFGRPGNSSTTDVRVPSGGAIAGNTQDTTSDISGISATTRNIAGLTTPAEFPQGRVILEFDTVNEFNVAYDPNGRPVRPISGTHFYGLLVRFECDLGICYDPPEANLVLIADLAGQVVELQPTNFSIEPDAPRMESIAESGFTTGWVIFQVPELRQPVGLIVQPLSPEGRADDIPPRTISFDRLQ